jgi:hypothetical protein
LFKVGKIQDYASRLHVTVLRGLHGTGQYVGYVFCQRSTQLCSRLRGLVL